MEPTLDATPGTWLRQNPVSRPAQLIAVVGFHTELLAGQGLQMREDESFAITKFSEHIGAEYADGEDPPDAYLSFGGMIVAAEVTQLVEPSYSADGSPRPRVGDDAVAESLERTLRAKFESKINDEQILLLCFTTPISNYRKLLAEAEAHICEMLANGVGFRPINMINCSGDVVDSMDITLSDEWPACGEKILCSTFNRQTSPKIRENIATVLRERILDKDQKCSGPHRGCEYWLVLLSTYWLARPSTTQSVYDELDLRHRFDRIYAVGGAGHVYQLF